jgi:hypothetical protein
MGNIKAINIKDTFGEATDAAIRKAIEAVKKERAELVVIEKKHGRPTKYSPKLCKLLPYLFSNGESVTEVCVHLDITKETFFQWVKQYQAFSDSYKKGLELSEAWWTRLGRLGSIGEEKIQPATWIFNMKNRFKWTDRQELNVPEGLQVDVATLSPEERRQRIAELMQKASVQP